MLTQEVLKQIRIGDVLKYLPSRKGAELIEAEITKIGNKYFYCKIHGKETKFELQTGKEVTDYMGGSLWIDDGSYQEYLELVDLKTKVRDAIRNLDLSKFTTEQLQNILNQLNPAQ